MDFFDIIGEKTGFADPAGEFALFIRTVFSRAVGYPFPLDSEAENRLLYSFLKSELTDNYMYMYCACGRWRRKHAKG
jgi:hypothetical protein